MDSLLCMAGSTRDSARLPAMHCIQQEAEQDYDPEVLEANLV